MLVIHRNGRSLDLLDLEVLVSDFDQAFGLLLGILNGLSLGQMQENLSLNPILFS